MGISAKILQLVNSAFFGLPREVSSVHMAVCYIGAEMLQNLVLSAEVFHVFEKGKTFEGFSFEDLHIHSQLTAKIAGRLLPASAVRDAAIVAALLHDSGSWCWRRGRHNISSGRLRGRASKIFRFTMRNKG